jgi:hypothetical protein
MCFSNAAWTFEADAACEIVAVGLPLKLKTKVPDVAEHVKY